MRHLIEAKPPSQHLPQQSRFYIFVKKKPILYQVEQAPVVPRQVRVLLPEAVCSAMCRVVPLEYRVRVLGEVFPGPLQHRAEGQEPLSLAEASAKENSYIFRNIVGKDAFFSKFNLRP